MSQTAVRARYQVIARVAAGGMGEVFRARDSVLDRDVAIKVLHRTLAGDPGFIDRFRREARAAALLSHPNIVAVHDWGATSTGTYFMVMEFVRGRNLRDLLSANDRLEPQQAVEVLLQILAALDHAHRRGIVHRDVKPENVLITPEGTVKVADFGLARALAEARVSQAPGTVTGTVQYLAPEQIHGEPADPRTDLYALGIVGYELLTGTVPFTGETSLAIAYKHLSDAVPPPSQANPSVPPDLDQIILAATDKDPDGRPSSALEMRAQVLQAAGNVPSAEPLADLAARAALSGTAPAEERVSTVTFPRALARKDRKRRFRHRFLIALVSLIALAAAGWGVWTFLIPHYGRTPNVVGLTVRQATSKLEAVGLDARLGPSEPSTTVDRGEVAAQSVAPGVRARQGSEVVLHVSTGLPLRTVPRVVGRSEGKATRAIRGKDLRVETHRAFSDTVRRGHVIEQNPDAGQRIQFGSVVRITVSKGPEPVNVPRVVGQPAGDAEQALLAVEFKVLRHEAFSATVPEGDVIRQVPAGGTADRGSRVIIWVSRGPREFPMPNVVGQPTAEAKQRLEAAGLVVHVSVVPGSDATTVVSQLPDPGVRVHQGQSVTIFAAL
jgi:beta-lactam-binding protein with PASTA domain